MDYGNRVGFWRMLDVLNSNKVRACCCLNLEILDHLRKIKDAMAASDWDYMAHGLYNTGQSTITPKIRNARTGRTSSPI